MNIMRSSLSPNYEYLINESLDHLMVAIDEEKKKNKESVYCLNLRIAYLEQMLRTDLPKILERDAMRNRIKELEKANSDLAGAAILPDDKLIINRALLTNEQIDEAIEHAWGSVSDYDEFRGFARDIERRIRG